MNKFKGLVKTACALVQLVTFIYQYKSESDLYIMKRQYDTVPSKQEQNCPAF